jgi:hypothetical protein
VNPLHQRFLKHRRYSRHHARDARTSAPPQVTLRVAIPPKRYPPRRVPAPARAPPYTQIAKVENPRSVA